MAVVGIPKETMEGETRCAAAAETVASMVKLGHKVLVEKGAGEGSHIPDADYEQSGATISTGTEIFGQSDVLLKVNPPTLAEAASLREGALLVSFLFPYTHAAETEALIRKGASVFAMDMIPRITRAQPMDALSSQANIAGYKAALMAADMLPRVVPMLMTAAGTIHPARFVVIGAGVAGLQAIATARRLGAVVEVSDVRLATKEQVESLGARFIEVEGAEDLEASGGYAREASKEYLERQRKELERRMVAADAVITTAQVPGKPAPRIITQEIVHKMRQGAVIVDLAAQQGGNCELTEPGKVVKRHGVTIVGLTNLPALVPSHATQTYARNILSVMELVTKGGELKFDTGDEIVDGALVVHKGQVRSRTVSEFLSLPTSEGEA